METEVKYGVVRAKIWYPGVKPNKHYVFTHVNHLYYRYEVFTDLGLQMFGDIRFGIFKVVVEAEHRKELLELLFS